MGRKSNFGKGRVSTGPHRAFAVARHVLQGGIAGGMPERVRAVTGGKGGRETAIEMVGFIVVSKQVLQARSEVPRPRMTNAGTQHTLSLI